MCHSVFHGWSHSRENRFFLLRSTCKKILQIPTSSIISFPYQFRSLWKKYRTLTHTLKLCSHNKKQKDFDQSVNTSSIVRNKYALVFLLLTLNMDLAFGYWESCSKSTNRLFIWCFLKLCCFIMLTSNKGSSPNFNSNIKRI